MCTCIPLYCTVSTPTYAIYTSHMATVVCGYVSARAASCECCAQVSRVCMRSLCLSACILLCPCFVGKESAPTRCRQGQPGLTTQAKLTLIPLDFNHENTSRRSMHKNGLPDRVNYRGAHIRRSAHIHLGTSSPKAAQVVSSLRQGLQLTLPGVPQTSRDLYVQVNKNYEITNDERYQNV